MCVHRCSHVVVTSQGQCFCRIQAGRCLLTRHRKMGVIFKFNFVMFNSDWGRNLPQTQHVGFANSGGLGDTPVSRRWMQSPQPAASHGCSLKWCFLESIHRFYYVVGALRASFPLYREAWRVMLLRANLFHSSLAHQQGEEEAISHLCRGN